ncbi:dapdiamide synthesis protein DdaC-like [Branchiostoma floridae x Branchiostoma japonicum]
MAATIPTKLCLPVYSRLPLLRACRGRCFSGTAVVGAARLVQVEEPPPYTPARLAGRQYLSGSHSPGFPEFLGSVRPGFPALFQPADATGPLEEWASVVKGVIDRELTGAGALLFRGLPIRTDQDFGQFCKRLGYDMMVYKGGAVDRSELTDMVYTAADEPLEMTIDLHTEMSYLPQWPKKLMFCCIKPPGEQYGGETPVTDMRSVLRDMDPVLLDRLRKRGIRYIRNIADRSRDVWCWQRTFRTEDREEVEKFLTERDFSFQWNSDDSVTYWYVMPATREHPDTGETLWFNQATSHHCSYFYQHPNFGGAGQAKFRYPFHTCYGDGEEFRQEEVSHMQQIQWRHAVGFHWQAGDVLVVDNMVTGHGRMGCTPGVSGRKVVVSLTSN